ncbi:MAG: type II secretion system protein M [Ruminococcus sp.]|nr:type II secretion system protein M [Ruminococcus sp.]
MKLNYRDKVILGILLAVVILIAGFVGLIKPKNEEIKEDEATLIAKQEEQADLEARIAKIEPLKKNINKTYEETAELTADFIPLEEISNSTQLDQYMQQYAEECGVRIDNVELSIAKEANINYYYNEMEDVPAYDMFASADLNGDYAKAQSEIMAESTALSQRNVETIIQSQYGVKVTGTKEAVWNYLKAVEELEKTMIVNQVNIEDYSFGADKAEEEGRQPTTQAETEENPSTDNENAEQPEDNNAESETPAGTGEETPAPASAPAALTIDDANTSSVQIVISLYSVYDMPKPNTEE